MTEKLLTEKQVKIKVVGYLRKQGWEVFTVYLGGIPTGLGMLASNPLKGFPDLICTHSGQKEIMYVELKKTKGGKVSTEQLVWHARLRDCNQKVYVITSIEDLKKEGL